jgi:hypothetical protein
VVGGLRRHDQAVVPPGELVRRVAEQAREARADLGDDAVRRERGAQELSDLDHDVPQKGYVCSGVPSIVLR